MTTIQRLRISFDYENRPHFLYPTVLFGKKRRFYSISGILDFYRSLKKRSKKKGFVRKTLRRSFSRITTTIRSAQRGSGNENTRTLHLQRANWKRATSKGWKNVRVFFKRTKSFN